MLEGQVPTQPAQRIIQPIYASRRWMKLLGIVMIVQGALIALSIIGLLIAWLPIWLGILLMKSAKKAEEAYVDGGEVDAIESLANLKTIFTIYGVVTIVGIGFMILYIVLIVALIAGGDFGVVTSAQLW
jgi:hypothetical protein